MSVNTYWHFFFNVTLSPYFTPSQNPWTQSPPARQFMTCSLTDAFWNICRGNHENKCSPGTTFLPFFLCSHLSCLGSISLSLSPNPGGSFREKPRGLILLELLGCKEAASQGRGLAAFIISLQSRWALNFWNHPCKLVNFKCLLLKTWRAATEFEIWEPKKRQKGEGQQISNFWPSALQPAGWNIYCAIITGSIT